MIEHKSADELALMREAGRITAHVLAAIGDAVAPGVTTAELDELAFQLIKKAGAHPAFLEYRGYPATLCVSPNDTVVHGIPGQLSLEDGDIVSVDVGVVWRGFYADSAATFPVGAVDAGSRRLIDTTKAALAAAVAQCVAGRKLSDISHAVQTVVEAAGFSVVRDFVGHGIGRKMHEDPQIPNFGAPRRGPELKSGMTFALEPMVNAGSWEVEVQPDGWTVLTADRSRSAHSEHTVAVTADGPEILTRE